MRKLIGVVLAGAIGFGSLAGALPARAESLSDALIAAYRNSDLLNQNRALLRVRDEDVAQAVAALRPVFDFVARSAYSNNEARVAAPTVANPGATRVTSPENKSLTLALTAEITLYDGGSGRMAIEAARELALSARQGLVGVENDILLRAVQSYMNVRLAIDTVGLRQSNTRVIERELAAARDRFELGEITRTDVAIAESRLAAARAGLASAEGDLAIERENYRLAVGAYPGTLTQPPRAPATARTLADARTLALRNHYGIKSLQHEVAAAELNVQRAEAAMLPRVSAGASYGIADNGLQNRSVNLNVSQRIYSGGARSSMVRQAMARRDAGRSGLHYRVAETEQGVAQAWARIEVARASIAASERQVAAARTALEGVSEEATLGARTTLDVLNAEQELLDAQAGRLQAITQEYTATYALLASMGLLTVDHLQLGIPTYDVSAYYNQVRNAPSSLSQQGRQLDRVLRAIGN